MTKEILPWFLQAKKDIEGAQAIIDSKTKGNYSKRQEQTRKKIVRARKKLEMGKDYLFRRQTTIPNQVWIDSYAIYTSLDRLCEEIEQKNQEFSLQNTESPDGDKNSEKKSDVYTPRKRVTTLVRNTCLGSLLFIAGMATDHFLYSSFSDPTNSDTPSYSLDRTIRRTTQQISLQAQTLTQTEYPTQLEDVVDKVLEGDFAMVVDKSLQALSVYQRTNWIFVKEMSCSTGLKLGKKEKVGDKKTPEGLAYVLSVENSSNWFFEKIKSYGPKFIRLMFEDYNKKDIGLHGTNEPEKLGTRASLGCIRVSDPNIIELATNYVKPGTPCLILPD